MSESILECKECGQKFKTERSLHAHIKKHNLTVAEYYTKFFPRKNLLTGKPMPFKNKKEYFSKDFSNLSQLKQWFDREGPTEETKKYILGKLKNMIKDKDLTKSPCHIDLVLSDMPTVDMYKKCFGSFSEACSQAKIRPRFPHNIVKGFFDKDCSYEKLEIFIDTREQKPLEFKKSKSLKLDFGDYTLGGSSYSYTYVDRKSEGDFKSTMSVGFERFKRELERAREFNSFMYIVVESSIEKIKKNNVFSPHKSNLAYIFHNARLLTREYSDVSQIIFSGGRKASQYLIPRLLGFGRPLWTCDMQYFIDKKIEEK